MKKLLLFHVFPINRWKSITQKLLSGVPHEDIFVHVSLPQHLEVDRNEISSYLLSYKKVRHIYYSINSKHPEVDAMDVFRHNVVFSDYKILSYMHAKGVTKPNDQNVQDWVELMRFFIIEKMELCVKVFNKGYLLYGVNKLLESSTQESFTGEFYYAGNFVSINLTPDLIEKIKTVPLPKEYHGLEGYWGKLCSSNFAYNAFSSRINHYVSPFPDYYYKFYMNRLKYSLISWVYHNFYKLKRYCRTRFLVIL